MAEVVSRRERKRREFLAEIGGVARRLVVSEGYGAVSMAAVAARLGVSAPALYRYVDDRTGLLDLACAHVAQELAAYLRELQETFGDDPLERVLGMFRALRSWAIERPTEYSMVFTYPIAELHTRAASSTTDHAVHATHDLHWMFEAALIRLWVERPFPVPPDSALPEGMPEGFATYLDAIRARAIEAGVEVPPTPWGAMAVLLGVWARVYGVISMEVFGHLAPQAIDGEPMLEYALDELVRLVAPPGE